MERLGRINVVKYGTDVITRENLLGKKVIDTQVMEDHGALLDGFDEGVLLVSSGAVGFGRSVAEESLSYIKDVAMLKRILAGKGNPMLSVHWQDVIKRKELIQSLISQKTDKAEAQRIIQALYEVPDAAILQVNGNDMESPNEMTRDNDKNAANLAIWSSEISESVRLILCTLENGFYTNFGTNESALVTDIYSDELTPSYLSRHCKAPSSGGTGGMRSKLEEAKRAVEEGGLEAWVIGGKDPKNLQSIFAGEPVGTRVVKGNITET